MSLCDQLEIDRTSTTPLHLQVERGIRHFILKNNVEPGSLIPSAMEISKSLSINHWTVRKAMKSLESQNILSVIPARGAFVTEDAHVQRVLWVTGPDQSMNDVSPTYSNLMRLAAKEAVKHQIRMEPVWLTVGMDEEIKAFIRTTSLSHYAGAIFHDCGPEHLLLHEVAKAGLPYVCIRPSGIARPFTVSHDNKGCAVMAMEYLKSRGHQDVLIVRFDDWPAGTDLDDLQGHIEQTTRRTGLNPINCLLPRNRTCIAHVVNDAKRAVSEFIARYGRVPSAVYMSDDIVARGVCLALIDYCARRGVTDLEVYVRCSVENIVPLGMPVTYMTMSAAEEVHAALELLTIQMAGQFPADPHRVISYRMLPSEQAPAMPEDPIKFVGMLSPAQ